MQRRPWSQDCAQVLCYTESVANLTLTIDDAVLRRARIRALEMDTSVNALVREYLTALASSDDTEEREALLALIDASTAGGEATGRTWAREEAYEDRLRWPRS